MSCSIEARMLVHFAARQAREQRAIQKKNAPKVERVIEEVFPTILDAQSGKERDPKAFFKDCDRMPKQLVIGNQTIYTLFKREFDEVTVLDAERSKIQKKMQKKPDAKLEAEYQGIDDLIASKSELLREKINQYFQSYLETNLGTNRMHLIPEICYRFSQKAQTLPQVLSDRKIADTYGVILQGRKGFETVSLHIPKNEDAPVEITSASELSYDKIFPIGKGEPRTLKTPFRVMNSGLFQIGLDGETRGTVQISLIPPGAKS